MTALATSLCMGTSQAGAQMEWRGIFQSAGGWAILGPESFGFARLLRLAEPGFPGPEASEFLRSAEGKWTNPQRTIASLN